jgi:hypothetical protein
MLKIDRFSRDAAKEEEKAEEKKQVKGTKPSLSLTEYTGTYTDELHGPLVVTESDGKLSAVFHGLAYDLEHWHYDTFRALDRRKRGPKTLITFSLGSDGKVAALKADVFGDTLDMKRTPPRSATVAIMLTEPEMKRFVGKYESKMPPLDLAIELIGGKLKVVVGGGQSAGLEPVKPTRFKIVVAAKEDAEEEAFVEFELDGDTVKGLAVEQSKIKIKFTRNK